MKLCILWVLTVIFSNPSFAGTSTHGADWFIHPLPLLKPKLGQNTNDLGLSYNPVSLRRCTAEDTKQPSGPGKIEMNVTYLPDKNWRAYRVLFWGGSSLRCSYGLAESDPKKALKLLIDNEDTNKVLYADFPGHPQTIRFSKATGVFRSFPSLVGTYLVAGSNEFKSGGYHLLAFSLQYSGQATSGGQLTVDSGGGPLVDTVYVPSEIFNPGKRTYFVQTVTSSSIKPAWRIVLPVALPEDSIQLYNVTLKKILNEAPPIGAAGNFDNYNSLQENQTFAWTSGYYSPLSKKLRKLVQNKFGFSSEAVVGKPWLLAPQIQVTVVPTIENSSLNNAIFHRSGAGGEIILPLGNQSWRTGADVVHELTHVLQPTYGIDNSDNGRFQNEMEAHTNEREHIEQVWARSPDLKVMANAFSYLVAATIPNVQWTDKIIQPKEISLCDEVINSYRLDKSKILPATLQKFGCK